MRKPKPLLPEVSVNGTPIPVSEIAAEAQNHSAPAGKPGIAWRKAARSLVIRELLLQEADRISLQAEPRQTGKGRRETDSEARIRQLTETAITVSPPSAGQVRDYYEANTERFRSPALYEASHILLAAPEQDPDRRSTARKAALRLLTVIRRDQTSFRKLASEHSACESAANGGSLGQLCDGDLAPEIEEVLKTLSPGQIADEPVETRYGIHLVRLDLRSEGRILPFEAVRGRIEDRLEQESWVAAGRQFVQDLVDRAQVTGIDMGDQPTPGPRSGAHGQDQPAPGP